MTISVKPYICLLVFQIIYPCSDQKLWPRISGYYENKQNQWPASQDNLTVGIVATISDHENVAAIKTIEDQSVKNDPVYGFDPPACLGTPLPYDTVWYSVILPAYLMPGT